MTGMREMTVEDHIALLREWRPRSRPNDGQTIPASKAPTETWRAKWVQAMCDQLPNLKPVSTAGWGWPGLIPVAGPSREEAERSTEAARILRLSDVRDENVRRLRTTLMAEAWMREIDPNAPQVAWLMKFHREAWGIREPVSSDGSEREKMAVLVSKRVSR